MQDNVTLATLTCPSGSYCPSPSQLLGCPPGNYCIAHTVTPISCDFSALIQVSAACMHVAVGLWDVAVAP